MTPSTYPMVRQLYCHACQAMTEHEGVDADRDPHTRLLWGRYQCRKCRQEIGETMTPEDYRALGEALEKEA